MKVSIARYQEALLAATVILTSFGITGIWLSRGDALSAADTGGSNAIRQGGYLLLLALIYAPLLLSKRINRALVQFPPPLVVLFAWCAATIAWSPVADIAMRRLLLTGVISIACLAAARQVPAERAVYVIWKALLALVLMSIATAILVPDLGTHVAGDPDSNVVGNWRGIYFHKNIFGSVSALCMIFSTHWMLVARRSGRLRAVAALAILASGGALLMSESKTSMFLSLLAMAYLVLANRVPLRRSRLLYLLLGAAAILVLVVVLAVLPDGFLARTILDPQAFTGRGFIWQSMLDAARDRPFTGVGFQSLFQVGDDGIFADNYNRYYQSLTQGHNSYLEIYASVGLIGLALAMWAIVFRPFSTALRMHDHGGVRHLLIAVMLYVFSHALLESSLMDRDRVAWVALLLCYGIALGAPRAGDDR